MAQNNAINNQSSQLTIDPAGATDSFIQFDESTTGKWRIGNDATDDSYRLSQGSALGTNDTFIMTSAGERTMPLQPCFVAELDGQYDNVTGDGTQVNPVGNWTEITDQNADFNVNGTFTAPITGSYSLFLLIYGRGFSSAHTKQSIAIITSNRNYVKIDSGYNLADPTGDQIEPVSSCCDMDAADISTPSYRVFNGTKVIDIGISSRWSGYLTC